MTVEEAFAMMEDAEKTKEDNTVFCEIDAETRKITVPETYKILGVESDEDSERVYFRAPRIVGDKIDLAMLGLRINYQNANSQKDSYPVDDLTVENEFITFSWLLSRKAVAYKGAVKFIVCAVRIGDNAEISNEWNTTLASAEVLEGLEVDLSGIPDEEGKDLLEALIAQSQVKLMEVGEATEEAKRSAERADTAADSAGHAADAANNAAEEARRAVEELKGNIGIDDNVVSENKTYSSKKIEEMAAVNWIPKLDGKFKFTKCTGSYQDGILTIESVDISTAQYAYFELKNLKQNTKYTVSWKSTRTGNIGGGIGVLGRKGSNYTTLVNTDTNTLNGFCYFDSGAYDAISFNFYCGNQNSQIGDSATFWDIMLVEGENETPYVENVRDVVKEVAKAKKRIETLENDTDISQKTVTFEMAEERAGVESGDSLAVAFGKLAKYCADLKPHVFADPVNNLLGTDATLPLAATQGKALDEKIEGVKADVTKLNGKTMFSGITPDQSQSGLTFNRDFMCVNLKNKYGTENKNSFFVFDDSDRAQWKAIPDAMPKSGVVIGYREVLWFGNSHVFVRMTEFYPMQGRQHFAFYNTGKWTGWKSITPV